MERCFVFHGEEATGVGLFSLPMILVLSERETVLNLVGGTGAEFM